MLFTRVVKILPSLECRLSRLDKKYYCVLFMYGHTLPFKLSTSVFCPFDGKMLRNLNHLLFISNQYLKIKVSSLYLQKCRFFYISFLGFILGCKINPRYKHTLYDQMTCSFYDQRIIIIIERCNAIRILSTLKRPMN